MTDIHCIYKGSQLYLGELGIYMRGGWYIAPDTLLEDYPELQSWEGLKNASLVKKLFATTETEPKGRFIDGVQMWRTFSERIISRLELPLQVVASRLTLDVIMN